jgi:hypothetical protein
MGGSYVCDGDAGWFGDLRDAEGLDGVARNP